MTDGGSGKPPLVTGKLPLRTAPRAHLWILGLAISIYFGASLALSCLRLLEFTDTNWDLGIFQQALWTTTHGYVFFEVGDWEGYATASFLQVHPTPILYLLVPVYAALPSPVTLLAIQSGAVALAALPLYQLGRRVLADSRRAVAMAVLYLAYAPILTANLYDFHLEAFLPLELFLLFLLWVEGRYLWGIVVAVATFATLEVTPFFVAALAVYFLIPRIRRADGAGPNVEEIAGGSPRGSPWGKLRLYLAERKVRWSLLLLFASALAYLLLRTFEWWVLPALLGVPPQPPAGTSAIAGPASASGLGLSWAFGANLDLKLGFWLLLVGLLGFLPLFSPRALVLLIPWFGFTMQSDHLAWVQLGYQYGFLAGVPLVLAAVMGLRRFELSVLPYLRKVSRQAFPRFSARVSRGPGQRGVAIGAVALLALLLASNVYMTPANPGMQNLNSALSGYRVSYAPTPGYEAVAKAAALVPSNALLLASDNLFPFVANDAQAYSLLWIPQQPRYLPFDPAHLPTFAFLSSKEQFAVPSWLFIATSNHTLYGLVASVVNTPGGTVRLWERGYSGPVQFSFDAAGGNPPSPPPVPWGSLCAVSTAYLGWPIAMPDRSVAFHISATLGSWY